jgi:ribosomal protein S18 acetylase RimI-like enzyme
MKKIEIDGAKDPISIRQAYEKDVSLLYSVCRQSYNESFADHWVEGGLTWYLDKVYGIDVLERDLKNPDITYFISYYEGVPAGFMKVKLNSSLSIQIAGSHLEVEKLYFLEKYKKKGLGKRMMTCVRELADKLGTDLIWLAVIDTNASAITFYENNGFSFFDKTRLEIPYFKDELRGMWRMILETGGKHHEKGTK